MIMEAELWTDVITGFTHERDADWPLEIGKNKETDSPLVLPEGIEVHGHLCFSPVGHMSEL